MPVVVVKNEGPDPQPGGRVRGGHERGDRSELIAEVVGYVQGRVAHRFDRPRALTPFVGAARGPDSMHRQIVVAIHQDLLGLRAVAGPVKLFARAEECERLQHLRAGVEKLAVKLPQRVGVLDGHLRRELAATLAGADLFATGPAVHATAAFEFDEITAVAQDNSFFEESSDGFHGLCRVEPLVW